ncbi:hypothetical protein [Shewanella sp.]|uniref:hypothetical protein n=1 Tax=Shewanella sp. TaxID=50422 RepID=UPI003567A657
MKNLTGIFIALAVGLSIGAFLFSSESAYPPEQTEITPKTPVSQPDTGAQTQQNVDYPSLETGTSQQKYTEKLETSPIDSVAKTPNEPRTESVEQYRTATRAKICQAAVTEDYCELSSATDFQTLLLAGGSVKSDAVAILLDADNYEIFTDWISSEERGERALANEELINTNLSGMIGNNMPNIGMDNPICSNTICSVDVHFQSEEEWKSLQSDLFKGSKLNAIFVSTSTPGRYRYLAFKADNGITTFSGMNR